MGRGQNAQFNRFVFKSEVIILVPEKAIGIIGCVEIKGRKCESHSVRLKHITYLRSLELNKTKIEYIE